MKKVDKFFIITLVASLIISVVTGVPQVRAETTTGNNENTTLTNSPTTKSTVRTATSSGNSPLIIKRLKAIFSNKLGIYFTNKETVIDLNGVNVEAYPSNTLIHSDH